MATITCRKKQFDYNIVNYFTIHKHIFSKSSSIAYTYQVNHLSSNGEPFLPLDAGVCKYFQVRENKSGKCQLFFYMQALKM